MPFCVGIHWPNAYAMKIADLVTKAFLALMTAAMGLHGAHAGSLVAWGNVAAKVPAAVASQTNFVAVSEVLETCLALRDDGTVVAWGDAPSTSSRLQRATGTMRL